MTDLHKYDTNTKFLLEKVTTEPDLINSDKIGGRKRKKQKKNKKKIKKKPNPFICMHK